MWGRAGCEGQTLKGPSPYWGVRNPCSTLFAGNLDSCDHDNWALRYCAAQSYARLYAITGDDGYIHVLGDHVSDLDSVEDCKGAANEMMKLVLASPSPEETDVLTELRHCFEVLFSNQKESDEYIGLMNELYGRGGIVDRARTCLGPDSYVTRRGFEDYAEAVSDLMGIPADNGDKGILEHYVPILTSRLGFFAQVFPAY